MNTTAITPTDDIVIVPTQTIIDYAVRALADWYQPDFPGYHHEMFKSDWRVLFSITQDGLCSAPDYVQRISRWRWPKIPGACFNHDWLADAVLNQLKALGKQS